MGQLKMAHPIVDDNECISRQYIKCTNTQKNVSPNGEIVLFKPKVVLKITTCDFINSILFIMNGIYFTEQVAKHHFVPETSVRDSKQRLNAAECVVTLGYSIELLMDVANMYNNSRVGIVHNRSNVLLQLDYHRREKVRGFPLYKHLSTT